jgi:hypothetical protein
VLQPEVEVDEVLALVEDEEDVAAEDEEVEAAAVEADEVLTLVEDDEEEVADAEVAVAEVEVAEVVQV